MEMLCYLNGIIDKFVKPTRKGPLHTITKSEKAVMMDNLVQEKEEFDVNMLGMSKSRKRPREHVQIQSKVQLEGNQETRNKEERRQRKELEMERNRVQEELNQSIEKLTHIKNEILDSVLMVKKIESMEGDKSEGKSQSQSQNSMYFSEEKGLDFIRLELENLPSSHKTEQPRKKSRNFFKLKGRREKVNISIEECNRLFLETLPKSTRRKKSRRKRSKRKRNTQASSNQTNTQTTRKSSRDPKLSVESDRAYKGLYNRHNSLFHRNKRNHPSKESLIENKPGINVWDKYSMDLPGSSGNKMSKICNGRTGESRPE